MHCILILYVLISARYTEFLSGYGKVECDITEWLNSTTVMEKLQQIVTLIDLAESYFHDIGILKDNVLGPVFDCEFKLKIK